MGKKHPAIAEYRVRDNKIRYADEAGEVIMKDNYVISTGFFQKLSIPKTNASWKFHIMMNKNEDKKEEWNHGTICGWAENEEIRCIIFYYEEW